MPTGMMTGTVFFPSFVWRSDPSSLAIIPATAGSTIEETINVDGSGDALETEIISRMNDRAKRCAKTRKVGLIYF